MVNQILKDVYMKGSLIEGSVSSESGGPYLNHVLEYIFTQKQLIEEFGLLEIGFGNGIVLSNLLLNGYRDLTGIEPGGHKPAFIDKSVNLVYDFFPSPKIRRKFGVVFHFGVWEHIENPINFMLDCLNALTDDGVVIFAVPNCTQAVNEGDVSMFIHEHFNYFTIENVRNIIDLSGGFLVDFRVILGMIIGTIRRGSGGSLLAKPDVERDVESNFWQQAQHQILKMMKIIESVSSVSDVAIYPGIRALNILFLLNCNGVRIVDDSSQMQSKFLPYIRTKVESFEQMCVNPPKVIVILSSTFGKVLIEKCANEPRLHLSRLILFSDFDGQ
jgi:SAM-dependent methyltransferase